MSLGKQKDGTILTPAESLRQNPLLIQKMPPLQSYDFEPEKLFFPNPYDYSDINKEKAFELSSEIYDKLVKGLTYVTMSAAAGRVLEVISQLISILILIIPTF